MKILPIVLAASAIATLAPGASANPHHHPGNGYYYRGPAHAYWYYPRYYFPYPFYIAPFVAAPYYAYPPPPMVARPVPPSSPQYREGERTQAQIVPPAPQRSESRAAIQPPERLERYTLSATELFEFDKATLRMPQAKLDEIARVLASNPSIESVTITGYTDRLGTEAYNLKLSQRRADAVKSYLVEKGVAAGRLSAVGKGEANPVVQCNDEDRAKLIRCLEPNRRVEVESITVEVRGKT